MEKINKTAKKKNKRNEYKMNFYVENYSICLVNYKKQCHLYKMEVQMHRKIPKLRLRRRKWKI